MTRPVSLLARIVLGGAVIAAAFNAYGTLVSARAMLIYSRQFAHESVEAAQDRLFGREYMAALRTVESRFGENASVPFVDDSERTLEWSYFALYHLAPRRLERVGDLTVAERSRPARILPRRVRDLLVVPGDGSPVHLVPVRASGKNDSDAAGEDSP